MAVAVAAAAVPVYDRRCTADWVQENERRAAAQRAEQQRPFKLTLTANLWRLWLERHSRRPVHIVEF